MNFFQHQAQARSQTRRLVLLFLLAVLAIVAAIDGLILAMLGAGAEHPPPLNLLLQQNSGALAGAALAVLAVIALATLYKSIALRSGGGSVARALGGTPLPQTGLSTRQQRLRNVVEEIAIASGVPVPEIYVLEQESGINAFAAGWSPADAAVCVTRGTLEKLNRDELQGVIAHEFSHILNGDMRLNIRLMGVLFGILVIAYIGRKIMRGAAEVDDGRAVAAGMAVGLSVMTIGYIGYFFGQVIKAGVSRQREFLADSSAVQFTRLTGGIAGALKKIGGVAAGSRLASSESEDVSHMLFGDGVGYSALFATHPPLMTRIQRLDPQFKPEELKQLAVHWNEPSYVPDDPAADVPVTTRLAGGAASLTADQVVGLMAQPSCDDYRHAEAAHAAIPDHFRAASVDEAQAWPLIFALLLDRDEAIRGRQLQLIAARYAQPCANAAAQHFAALGALAPAQRLPLAALCFPVLKRRPKAELAQFLATVTQLIRADGKVGMFEFCLGSLLRTQLADALNPVRAKIVGKRKLGDSRAAALSLIAVLAQQGHAEATLARQAFAAGATHLFAQAAERYAPPADAPALLEDALKTLDQLDAPGKQLVIEAMVKTLNHDQRITVGEAELLRAVCASLHCPLPPLMGA